jgi:uncharacterized protein YigA (DUF484 family)
MSSVTQAVPSEQVAQPTQGVDGPDNSLDDAAVAHWLLTHPDFFEQHPDVLADVRLREPHRGRTISLVERQVLVLRERSKALEARMAELMRIGRENDAIGMRLQELTWDLLCTREGAHLPAVLFRGLQTGFGVPQVAIRLWGIEGIGSPFSDPVSEGLRRRVEEWRQPYCGPNSHAEPAAWLPGAGEETKSIALLSLRMRPATGAHGEAAFGLLVLGSGDAARFQAGMGTAFLERIAEIASASLSRLVA